MKNLILLFLVIGAVVSTTYPLTTQGDPDPTAALPLWSIAYVAVTGTSYYSFELTYNAGSSTTQAVDDTDGEFVGVACMLTDSAHTLTDLDIRAGISFSIAASNAAGTQETGSTDNWQPLVMTSHPVMAFTDSLNMATGLGSIECPITITNTADDKPTITANVVSWTFTVADLCGSLPIMGETWYAKCWSIPQGTFDLVAAASTASVKIFGAMDVTITTAAASCATTGASTFATGATILAGIAYLQF
jgi:hypothetical protein